MKEEGDYEGLFLEWQTAVLGAEGELEENDGRRPEEEIRGGTTCERRCSRWRRDHSRHITRPERSHQAILPWGPFLSVKRGEVIAKRRGTVVAGAQRGVDEVGVVR